jgi:hypothetical protein
MPGHWKKMMDDKEMLAAHDLDGRDVTITIERVVGGEVRGENNKKNKKPIAHIKGKTKKLALNVTNCKTIEQLVGTPDPAEWGGLRITLFPTTTDMGGKTVECIRVRPYHPKPTNGNKSAKPEGDLTQQIADKMAETASATVDTTSVAPAANERGPDDEASDQDNDIPDVDEGSRG